MVKKRQSPRTLGLWFSHHSSPMSGTLLFFRTLKLAIPLSLSLPEIFQDQGSGYSLWVSSSSLYGVSPDQISFKCWGWSNLVYRVQCTHPQHSDWIWTGTTPYRLPYNTLSEYPDPWSWKISGSERELTSFSALRVPDMGGKCSGKKQNQRTLFFQTISPNARALKLASSVPNYENQAQKK